MFVSPMRLSLRACALRASPSAVQNRSRRFCRTLGTFDPILPWQGSPFGLSVTSPILATRTQSNCGNAYQIAGAKDNGSAAAGQRFPLRRGSIDPVLPKCRNAASDDAKSHADTCDASGYSFWPSRYLLLVLASHRPWPYRSCGSIALRPCRRCSRIRRRRKKKRKSRRNGSARMSWQLNHGMTRPRTVGLTRAQPRSTSPLNRDAHLFSQGGRAGPEQGSCDVSVLGETLFYCFGIGENSLPASN